MIEQTKVEDQRQRQQQDPLIPLGDVPRLAWLPHRRGGKRLHVFTLIRWAPNGPRGHRPEAIRAGGTLVTTEAALRRFFERLAASASSAGGTPIAPASTHRTAGEHGHRHS